MRVPAPGASGIWDVRLEQLHGLAPGGFGGTYEDWLAALHPDDREECLARVERALAKPRPYLLLHRTTWPDGSVRWIECRGARPHVHIVLKPNVTRAARTR